MRESQPDQSTRRDRATGPSAYPAGGRERAAHPRLIAALVGAMLSVAALPAFAGAARLAQWVATASTSGVNQPPVADDDAYLAAEDSPLTIPAPGVLDGDTDVDGGTLSALLETPTINGTLTLNPNGSFSYVPSPNANGTDVFTYRAKDGLDNSNLATVTLTVAPVNDPPVANDESLTGTEDTPRTPHVVANDTDVDGDVLVVSAVTQGENGTVTFDGGTVTYTPEPDFHGTDDFEYTVSDGKGGTDTGTVTLAIAPLNDAPTVLDESLATSEDAAGTVDVLANDFDVEDDPLTILAVTQGISGSVTFAGASVTYTPGANFNGLDLFEYTVGDGNGGINTGAVNVTVAAVNDVPSAADDAMVTAEDVPRTVLLVANDTDVDGHALSVSAVTQGAHGVVTFEGGSATYSPNPNFNGTDSFAYTVSDGNGGSDGATVSVTVTLVNDPPVAMDESLGVIEDTAGTVGVLGNDTDIENDTLRVSAVTNGMNGSVTFDGGNVTYTPNANFSGNDAFDYTLSDGNGGFDTGTVGVIVSAVNDPPIAVDDNPDGTEDTVRTLHVVSNDTDADGDVLLVTAVTQGTNGTVTFGGGSVTYSPVLNFHGTDSFQYTVSDGNGGTDTGTVAIAVAAVNDAPSAVDDFKVTIEDTAATLDVITNDSDVENSPLSVSAVTQGIGGTVTFSGGSVTYTPNANFHGGDSFEYTVSDGNGGLDTASVGVTTTPVNDPPVTSDDVLVTPEDGARTASVVANDDDVDRDVLTITGVTQGMFGTVTVSGVDVTYTPIADFHGSDAFGYTVSDGNGGSDSATVAVTVDAVNDRPRFSDRGARAHAAGTGGVQTVPNWAFDVVPGPANESSQAVLEYVETVAADPNDVVTSAAVASDGTLQYALTGSTGMAQIDVRLRDNGGTATGGDDTSVVTRLLIGVGIEADLRITKTDRRTTVREGDAVSYTIVASNGGGVSASAARVTDLMPPDLVAPTWTCAAAGGAACPASGSGDIEVAVDLPIGGSVAFTLNGTAQGVVDGVLENTAFIETPPAVFDPDPASNVATDSDALVIFAAGFEDP